MLSIFPLRNADPARYYIEAVSAGAEEYYVHRDALPGRWLGRVSPTLGLSGVVGSDDLRTLLEGRRLDGGSLRDTWVLRPGFDATFSAPKSVSVLWALADRATALAFIAAHEGAVEAAIAYLERRACQVRRGGMHGRGVSFHPGGGFVCAAFRHLTSREGDPQLHSHVLIINVTLGPDGRWTGIDSKYLHAHAKAATAVYQAVLRRSLVKSLGLRFEISGNGTGDVAGVSRQVLRGFSKRRVAIENHMRKRGTSGARAAEVATLATRRAKEDGVSEMDLRIRWHDEAAALGFDPASVSQERGRRMSELLSDHEIVGRITLDDATFNATKAVWVVAANAVDGADLADIEQRADAFLASPLAVRLSQDRWTTTEMLAIEERVLMIALNGRRIDAGRADDDALSAALAVRPSMSDEQVAMVRDICTSGDRIDTAVGAPGSGKTVALDAARVAWQESGHRVIGCALAARAARGLQVGSGIPSHTIDRLLLDLDSGQERLSHNAVVVVDEAAMVGTRKLARLVDACDGADAKLVLVGDPKQLPAIDAGGLFEALAKRLGAAELTGNRRQQNPTERKVVADLRDGNVQRAIDRLNSIGGIAMFHNADKLADSMVQEWHTATKAGKDVLMLAPTRDTVAELNARARQRRVSEGELGPVVAQVGEAEFAVGDRVLCTRNNKRLDIVNGDVGTVESATKTGVVVRLANRAVELTADYLAAGNLTHGYALTVHKAQGATSDVALLWGADNLTAESGYTTLTRGRIRNRVFVMAETAGSELVPPEQRDPAKHLAQRLSAAAHSPAAIDAGRSL